MPMRRCITVAATWALLVAPPFARSSEPAPTGTVDGNAGPAARWLLAGDASDSSGHDHHAVVRGGIDFDAAGPDGAPRTAAAFNGRDAWLEAPAAVAKSLAGGRFSLTAWVCPDEGAKDLPGDIISQYDVKRRRGFQLSLKTNTGVASAQANWRNLQFGIDNDQQTEWTDCGRPGNAILAFALTTFDGHLYAGTCEAGADQAGHVYRYTGNKAWTDCGSPAPCNAVTSLAELDGKLYAGVGKYRLAGSSLDESPNANLGGRVFRYEGGTQWTDCGQLPGVEAIGGMVVYGGKLYASSLYRPAGFFRYDGGMAWTDCGTPGKRVEALGVYDGYIYATSYDGGLVFRYDGTSWTDCGQLGSAEENTQTYSFAVYQGRLYVGTWRTGRVYRFEDVNRWTDVGRLGEELEVMGMLVHNGRLLAGTLPLAEVYSYEGDATWRRLAQLDATPEVRYRRAWTMAEFDGQVFCSTLPSGHIYSYTAGVSAMDNRAFPTGWHHVAAIKRQGELCLYVDGRLQGTSRPFDAEDYELANDAPLRIGFGQNDYFHGRLHDVRCYNRAIDAAEIEMLSRDR
ncbi:MAG: LamG-like jellyroll fold domain-containing protein [Pirellulales bacterium]